MLDGLSLSDDRVWNVDETRATLSNEATLGLVNSQTTEATKPKVKSSNFYTLVTFISASGTVLFSVYIFKCDTSDRDTISVPCPLHSLQTRNSVSKDWPIYVARNTCGYMNGQLWKACLMKFAELTKQLRGVCGKLPILLWADGASMHKNLDALMLCQTLNIDILFFPANTTHFTQPLDGSPFGRLKAELKRIHRRQAFEQVSSLAPEELTASQQLREAELLSLTPATIKQAFVSRGIWPFSREIVMANFRSTVDSGKNSVSSVFDDSRVKEFAKSVLKCIFPASPIKTAQVYSNIPSPNQLYLRDSIIEDKIRRLKEKAHKDASKEQNKPRRGRPKGSFNKNIAVIVDSDSEEDSNPQKSVEKGRKRKLDEVDLVDALPPPKRSKRVPNRHNTLLWSNYVMKCSACNEDAISHDRYFSCSLCQNYGICWDCQEEGKNLDGHIQDEHMGGTESIERPTFFFDDSSSEMDAESNSSYFSD